MSAYEIFVLSQMPDFTLSSTHRSPTFAIRGDIASTTGYARAARALAEILAENYPVLGVSIHEDPADRSAVFPANLVNDGDLRTIAQNRPLVVINHTTPSNFLPICEACNIGLFYWETDAIPRKLSWPEQISCMDAIWAPTQFVADFVRSCGYDGPVALIPWAQQFEVPMASTMDSQKDIKFDLLSELGHFDQDVADVWSETSLDRARRSGSDVFLAIQSLSPRKGLPILINEWCRYLRDTPDSDSLLLLKLNFRHAHGINSDPHRHLVDLLRRYGVPDGISVRIGLISDTLTDKEMLSLIARSSALVSCSYGEGFCAPIVEALTVGTTVITSRHTGISSLLPEDYPFQYRSRLLRVQLRDLIDVYPPSSSWFVPEAGALADALTAFQTTPLAQRAQAVSEARAYAQAFCGAPVVRDLVSSAVAALTWRQEAP